MPQRSKRKAANMHSSYLSGEASKQSGQERKYMRLIDLSFPLRRAYVIVTILDSNVNEGNVDSIDQGYWSMVKHNIIFQNRGYVGDEKRVIKKVTVNCPKFPPEAKVFVQHVNSILPQCQRCINKENGAAKSPSKSSG